MGVVIGLAKSQAAVLKSYEVCLCSLLANKFFVYSYELV